MKGFVDLCVVLLVLASGVISRELHPLTQIGRLFQQDEYGSLPEDPPPIMTMQLVLNQSTVLYADKIQMDSQMDKDVRYFKEQIADYYKFEKDPRKDMWKIQGDFSKALGSPHFIEAAERAKEFFLIHKDWEETKKDPQFRKTGVCTELLYVTAARYLFVTHVLWERSGKKLISCKREDNFIVIPNSGVCYPAPYGTASCTSDYDVGLVGKDAGILTETFNDFFQNPTNGFEKPSELVFDTNVYAFTLEYAMPAIFKGLPPGFPESVKALEEQPIYKMQELAGAYLKVYKYNEKFSAVLFKSALDNFPEDKASKSKAELVAWKMKFDDLNILVPLKGLPNLRAAHNSKYQEFVKKISLDGGYNAKDPSNGLGVLTQALLYAAEAYHTRGAIRHVVGGTQMKVSQFTHLRLPVIDLWVSMLENWGESNKEYNHCKDKILQVCLMKMSKYMWRMFEAMRRLRKAIPPTISGKLVTFLTHRNPADLMSFWLEVYKRSGRNKINDNEVFVNDFLRKFKCTNDGLNKPISEGCIQNMNEEVNKYNMMLARLTNDNVLTPAEWQADGEVQGYWDNFLNEELNN